MTLTQKLLGGASLAVSLASVSVAQQASVSHSGSGLLGQKYVETGVGYVDVNHSDRGFYAAGADVNLPVAANFDVNLNYAHGWVENNDSLYTNTAGVDLVGYFTDGAFRPFVTGGLGYVWVGSGDDDYGVWNAGAGVEYSINANTAVTLSGNYGESFDNGDDGTFSGTVGLNYWFTSSVGGNIAATYIEGGNVGYAASVVFKF